ncbi:restriction endonuclease subunit S [Arachidicoccus sp.]|uniref:restriction endonuclease subunit S n=1 Tax=Arachidicoccus sp. TaxID=1872624 RepID=UPI003D22F853
MRFTEFTEEWETKKLGEVMEFKVTNFFSRENLNYEIGTVKNIHYGDIHTKFQTLFDITNEIVPFINDEINVVRISDENYCREGDVIFADASEDLNDVGKSIEIINVNGEKLLSGLHTLLGRPKSSIFHLGFNGYLFKSNSVRTQIQKESQGSKVLSINTRRISKIELSFPSVNEQEKITPLLSLLDERIQTQNKIIKELNVLKATVTKRVFSCQLRFKDENGNSFPEWEEKKLGEIAHIKSGLSKDQNCNSYGYKVTRIETISDGTINLNKIGYIDFDGNIDDYKIKKGDILLSNINSVSHIGKTAIAYFDLELYHGMNLLCIKSKYGLNPLFLYYYLNTVKIRNYFKSICNQAVSQASINQTELGKTMVVFPLLKEQTKIAEFLSSIDSKIDIEIQLLQKLEGQKRFLLQQMFV